MDTKKAIRSVLVAVSAVMALLFLTAFFVARSQVLRQFLLAKIIRETEASTGARVEVKKVALRWSPFTAELFGIVLHGQEQNTEAPLFLADHLRVGLSVKSLLQRKVDVSEIALDNPIVHLRVDAQGRSNMPQAPTKASSSSSFTLLIQRLIIRNGLIHYNDKQIPLSAELQGFTAQTGFDTTTNSYRGSLGYGQGWILTKGINPFEHNVQVDFEANRDGLALSSIVLSSGRSRLVANAKVIDFANPRIEGKYDGVVLPAELAHIVRSSAVLSGEVALSGTLTYRNLANEPSLNGVDLRGRLDSRALALRLKQISTAVKSIHASYQLHSGDFRVEQVDADLLDGHLTANAEMLHLSQNPSSHLSVALHGVSMEKVSAALPASARQNVRLKGHLDLQAQAAWSNDIQRLTAHSHAEIHGLPSSDPRANAIPVDGLVDVSYDGATRSVSFGQSHIRSGSTELLLKGVWSQHSSLDVDLKAGDLHELAALASAVMAAGQPSNASSIDANEVHGSARFAGQVSGSMTDPRIKGQLSGNGLQVQESKWRTVRASIDVSSSSAALQNGYLESDQQGHLSFDGRASLQHWSLPPANPVFMHAKITRLSINELERLGKLAYPVYGDLSGEFWVGGSQQNPTGRGSLQLVHASAWGEPVKALKLDFQSDKGSLQSTGQLQLPAGSVDANLTYSPEAQRYDANVSTVGLDLGRVQTLREHAGPVSGSLTATVAGKGTIEDPQLNAQVQIPELQISGQEFEKIQAQLNLAHQHADFSVDSTAAEGYVQAKGGVDLKDAYLSNATMDVRALPLGPLLGKYLPEQRQDLQGLLEIHGAFNGPLKELARLEGHVEVPTFNLKYKDIQIAIDRPLRMRYSNGTVTVEEARIKGTGSELSVQGAIPFQSTAAMNVSAKGTVDLGLLQTIVPDAHASGQVQIDLKASGNPSRPMTQGQIRIVNTSLSAESLPVALSGIDAEMVVSGNRIDLRELKGIVGGGTISSHGSFIYGPQPNFDLELEAKAVRIHQTGIRATIAGKVQLSGSPQKSLLSGKVLVDRLSFQEGFDLSTFLGQFSGEPIVSTQSTFQNNMQLNVTVQSTQDLNLASSQLSVEGSADLHVAGTAGNPVILGRVVLTGGEVFFLNKRFEIQSGTIAFANPVRTEPVVNLFVNTTVQQYKITMNFVGPLDRLKTNYTSDPSLPPLDIINLLAFGKTAAESASNTSTPPSLGAESALAQGVAGQVGKGVQNMTGISQLTIDPMAGNTQNPGAQVSIQQRVTGSVLLTFSTDVTSTQSQTVQLQYQPKPQVTISVLRDQFGGYGFDVRLHKVF
jgi:autotransporter translocation and assembly factor TamB